MSSETLQELIMQILEEDERARDDDLWLTWRVYNRISRVFIPFEDFKKLPRPESISRIRRFIQNTLGLYPGKRQMQRLHKVEQSRKFWAEVSG